MLPPTTRPLHVRLLGGQWDHMSNSQPRAQTSYALSQRQSGSSGLGLSPPPAKRPHFEPQTQPVRSNNELQSTYYQSQTNSSGLGSLPAKTTGVKSPMDQYIDYVKNLYQQSVIEKDPSALKWPPTPSEVFINLACIDRRTTVKMEEADEYTRALIENGNIDVILKKKTMINFGDIAQGLQTSERIVLVEGAPGVGKSTFAWEFCRRWERREIARKYQLVLILKLRDERMSRAKSLQDLIYHPNPDISHDVQCALVDSHGDHTLIILEGFDELPDSQQKESSIFLQLILGQLLLYATIMITSRPWATGKILKRIEHRIFQHIEVLGFTEENAVKYIKSVFTEKYKKTVSALDQSGSDDVSEEATKNIDDVMAYVDKYPQIKASMYIPLNAAIVVSIYQDSMKGKCILPKTLTELYYALTQILLLRYLYGHADYKEQEWNIDSFEKDLPDEVYRQLLTICKVAYDGVCKKGKKRVQLIFSDHDLGGCETLGFMQSVAEVFVKHGRKMSHNFLHLTVQEFLAAVHISKMSLADQLKHFQKHKDGRLKVVLRFLAGYTELKQVTRDQLMSLFGEPTPEESNEQHTSYCNSMRPDICVSAHHTNWLFESQNSKILQSLFQNHIASFTFTTEMSPLEYYSVGYCIAHSHSKWLLILDGDAEKERVNMLMKGADTGGIQQCRLVLRTTKPTSSENLNLLLTSFSGCVEELYLRVMTPLSLPDLSALRILELSLGGKLSDISASSFPILESLTVVKTNQIVINPDTEKTICKILSSSSSIIQFKFKSNISDQSMEGIVRNLCDNTAIELKSLEIEAHCKFTSIATECLSKVITRSTGLQNLKMHDNKFDSDIFTKCLADNIAIPLKILDIDCKYAHTFTTTAARFLTKFITGSTMLQYLKIHIDTFEDVDVFAKGLSDNVGLPLKSLDISCNCKITTTGARSLVQFITKSTTLQLIRICQVTFSAQGLTELIGAIHHCSRLQEQQLKDLSFTVECSEDIVILKHMIKDHPDMPKSIDWEMVADINLSSIGMEVSTLNLVFESSHVTSLFLTHKVSDAGEDALVQALHHNPTLKELRLANSISDAGVIAIAQALYHNSTLEVLELPSSSISDAGGVALAQALTHNSTLKRLTLSRSSITDDVAVALAQALHHNSTLKKLILSDNSISDTGAVALADVLHHNSSLKFLSLAGNSAIGKEGTHQLVKGLTVHTSIRITLSRKCKNYATQCTEHNTVSDRIDFC